MIWIVVWAIREPGMLDVVASRNLVDSLPLASDQLTEAMVRRFIKRLLSTVSAEGDCYVGFQINTRTAMQVAFVNILSSTRISYCVACLALASFGRMGREGTVFLCLRYQYCLHICMSGCHNKIFGAVLFSVQGWCLFMQ